MDLISLDTYPSSYKGSDIPVVVIENFDQNLEQNKDKDKNKDQDWVSYDKLEDCLVKGGKCYFDVISQGLRKAETRYSSKKLRNLLYKYLVNNESEYKMAKGIKTKKQLASYVKTFDGYDTLPFLSKLLNIDFYIFENETLPKEIGGINNKLLLLNTSPGILGLKQSGKKLPQTLFNRNDLPQVLTEHIDPNVYFKNNITQFYNNNKQN